MMDRYAEFADRYDLFFEEFGVHPAKTVAFFRRLFQAEGVRSVLDCACGTGHDLVMFHNLGMDTYGSDSSVAMLAQAGKNLERLGLHLPLSTVDYRDLPAHFSMRFGAVACLSSSILEMPDEDEVMRALRSMRGVLAEGGLLVLSQGTTDKQWKERPRFILAVNRQDLSRLFVIDYEDCGAHYNVVDILHGGEKRDLRVWTAHYNIMLLRDDYEHLLGEAGFGRIDFYGSYDFATYDKAVSDLMIAVARV